MSLISNDSIKNLILQGAPGTGKTRLAKQLALYLQEKENTLSGFISNYNEVIGNNIFKEEPDIDDYKEIKIAQFHPGYTYEDFVRGIITEINDKGKLEYKVQNKILMQIVNDASKNKEKKFVLIIDEINRANIPSVLGELIYALEYRGEKVNGIYTLKDEIEGIESNEITIPDNLYIIGTMNTADRSIGHIDYAIRRRFVFKEIPSDIDVIKDNPAKELYLEIERLFDKETNLSPDFNKTDVLLGHSYFLTENRNINQRLEFEIKPLLREYIKDGILIGENIPEIVEKLTVNE